MADWNKTIINEFRANEGRVGCQFEGVPILLLHHKGAKTGTERVNPVAYQPLDDGGWAVFASKAGAPTNPDWYHNVMANPKTTAEVGPETIAVTARAAKGEERTKIWEKQKELIPGVADYENKTDRQIPVVILERP